MVTKAAAIKIAFVEKKFNKVCLISLATPHRTSIVNTNQLITGGHLLISLRVAPHNKKHCVN